MKKIKILLIIISISFMFSCVSDQEFLTMKRDIYALNSYNSKQNEKIYKLEKELNKLQNDFSKYKKSLNANLNLRFSSMELEIKSIRNQLNDLSSISSGQGLGNETMSNEVEQEAIKDIFAKLNDLEDEINNLKSEISSLKSNNANQLTDTELYKKAYSLFTLGKYEESAKKFQEFIKKFPDSKLIPNAYYWLGETYFKRGMYEKAIINYDEVIVKYSKSPKVPAALLKEGISFMKIGENDGAKIIFKKILRDYPNSPQAKYAKIYLKSLR